jgi:hypothetical protein
MTDSPTATSAPWPARVAVPEAAWGEKDVRLAQKMQVVPRIIVGIQLDKAEVGPASGSTWRLSHYTLQSLFPNHPAEYHSTRDSQNLDASC